jgi:cytosine/adenosine deaminase-related metal-dependent hydrolase
VRLDRLVPPEVRALIEEESMQDVDDNLEELETLARDVVDCYPHEISSRTVTPEGLLEVNRVFRDIKHVLLDVDESLRELEDGLRKGPSSQAARYVTKLRKDVENFVSFILIKVNGRITDSVNGFQI